MKKFPIKTVYYSSYDEDHVCARPHISDGGSVAENTVENSINCCAKGEREERCSTDNEQKSKSQRGRGLRGKGLKGRGLRGKGQKGRGLKGRELRSKGLKSKKKPKVLYGKRKGFKYNFLRFILYRCLATPAAFLWSRLIKRERIIGREKLRSVSGGCFIYSNHTNAVGDAFSPNVAVFPRSADIIISRENFSVSVVGGALSYLGGIPTPETIREMRGFFGEVERSVKSGRAVVIYPEAHLWQYMTKPRPFAKASFTYPARLGTPVFAMTRVYKKTKRGFRCELYVDGPFYPDTKLSVSEATAELCERVSAAIQERCKLSDCEVIRYLRRDCEESGNE